MTKQTSAASAASFLSTKADKAPKSRKPSTKAKDTVVAPAVASVAAQLAAAQPQIAAKQAETAPYNLTTCPKCGSDELFTGRCDAHGIVQDEQLVGGCHVCDWTYDVRTKRTAKTPDLKLVIVKAFKPRTNQLVDRKVDGKGNFAQDNNWDALVKAIQAHGGEISYADAVAAVEAAGKAGGYEKTCNARGFVQGRVRNGHVKAA